MLKNCLKISNLLSSVKTQNYTGAFIELSSITFRQILTCRLMNMQYTEDHIKTKLIKELDATHVEVIDESDGCGDKFSCVVVSNKFQGKPLLQRHRLVNSVLEEELKSIHAFSQKTFTPEQWNEQK